MEKKLVWWLLPEEYGALLGLLRSELAPSVSALPDYIKTEIASLSGRYGRGRLWVSPDLGTVSIENFDTKPLAEKAGKCGGIVIWQKDAPKIQPLIKVHYGFLTDLNLDPQLSEAEKDLLAMPGNQV